MAAVIGADGVDLTLGQLLPQDIRPRLFTGGRRKFHIGADLGAILLAESQVVGAGLTVDVVAFCLGLVDDVHRAGVAGVDDDQAAFGVAVEVDGSADGLVLLELGAGIQIRGDVFPALGLQVLLLDMDQRVVLGVDADGGIHLLDGPEDLQQGAVVRHIEHVGDGACHHGLEADAAGGVDDFGRALVQQLPADCGDLFVADVEVPFDDLLTGNDLRMFDQYIKHNTSPSLVDLFCGTARFTGLARTCAWTLFSSVHPLFLPRR